jgi:hypothetical protein
VGTVGLDMVGWCHTFGLVVQADRFAQDTVPGDKLHSPA